MAVDPSLTLHERIIADCVLQVQALQLAAATGGTGDVGDNVKDVATVEDVASLRFPAVLVGLDEGMAEEEGDSSFETDEVIYPVGVWVVDRASARQGNPSPRADWLAWRRLIARQFRSLVTLPDCPEAFDVRVFPRAALSERHPAFEYVMSSLLIKFWTSEVRLDRP